MRLPDMVREVVDMGETSGVALPMVAALGSEHLQLAQVQVISLSVIAFGDTSRYRRSCSMGSLLTLWAM
jgi:hypothetical protein